MDPRAVVSYLLERGLVDAPSTWSAPLRLSTTSTRYTNFAVTGGGGQSYFIKHSSTPSTVSFLAREAAVYELLRSSVTVKERVPQFVLHDPGTDLLVLALVPEAVELIRHLFDRREQLDICAAELGRFFATLHGDAALAQSAQQRLPLPPPWVCALPLPTLETFTSLSAATRRLIAIVQRRDELSRALSDLASVWKPRSLVHFDFKWGNCLMPGSLAPNDPTAHAHAASAARFVIIDWEFGGFGDPRWDVGSVIESFVGVWLRSIPMTDARPPEFHLAAAQWPFTLFEGALRAFVDGYRAHAPMDHRFLVDSVRFAGARLIQSAYESTQTFNALPCSAVCSLQVGENLLRDPNDGVHALLGQPDY